MHFAYVDGSGGGVFDYYDESFGPRLDAGLLLPQFDSPYNAETGTYTPTPFLSHPDNIKSFFQNRYYINIKSLNGGWK